MNVLAIGNSFSQDATRYLHDIAASTGTAMTVANLYIGGCSLETHHTNLLAESPSYSFEFNGESTGLYVSIQQALRCKEWDVVTIQQASHFSTDYGTYTPYAKILANAVRELVPKARLFIHETWAYEEGSERLRERMHMEHSADMYTALRTAYAKTAGDVFADGIIPSGTLFEEMRKESYSPIHRDTFHASYGLGRYALGLLWYAVLTGKKACDVRFEPGCEAAEAEQFEKLRLLVDKLANNA